MSALKSFQMPVPVKITGRTSSITNSFVNAIIPVIEPNEAEIIEALTILGLDPLDLRCAYCGDKSTEWDHLRPLIRGKQPTGYISEIANLVPACGKCNQSKGNKYWKDWMLSSAKLSPKTREIEDISARIQALEAYEAWKTIEPIDIVALVGSEVWEAYMQKRQLLMDAMRDAQEAAELVKKSIAEKYQHKR
jgi:hypothetical protein